MPLPSYRLLDPVLSSAADLTLRLDGCIGNRVQANIANWLITAPATNPGMIGLFNHRAALPDAPVPWAGEFAGKYLISAVQALAFAPNSDLESVVSQFVTGLIATQGPDGSLGLPLQWDLWGQYHVILGLLRWYERTGDAAALATCQRAANLAYARYIDRASAIVSDDPADAEKNQTISHALLLLYEFTGQEKYLQLVQQIESDWAQINGSNNFLANALAGNPYHAGNRPRWETLHDVQAVAELYYITGQPSYRQAFEQIWGSIRDFDRHVTGGFTSGEAATGNAWDPRYIETCGTIAWMALTIDKLRMSADPTAADELELSLFNAVMGAQTSDGRNWTYHTPMGGIPIDSTPPPADRLGYRLPAYYDLAWQSRDRFPPYPQLIYPQLSCCAMNGPRGLGCLREWAVMNGISAVAINFYGPSTAELSSPTGTTLTLTQQTDYPASGLIQITVEVSFPSTFAIDLRIPAWSQSPFVMVNASPVPASSGTYCSLYREWNSGDVISLNLDLPFRASQGQSTAQGLLAVYYGPRLLALDSADTTCDLFNPPTLTASDPPQALPQADLSLRAVFQTPQGPVTLRDFASAGQGQEGALTGKPNTDVVWEFSRSNQTVIAEQIRLLGNGVIQGYSHPNETRWALEGDLVTFYDQVGAPSTRFTMRLEQHGKQVLSGVSLLDTSIRHLLSEVDFTIVGKTWTFRRIAPANVTLLPVVRLLQGGEFDIATNPNEHRWAMEGNVLVFYAANGVPSTRFTSIQMQNGRTTWRGQFLFDSSITHELVEIDLDVSSMIWRFVRRQDGQPDFLLADKVRLLPGNRIDGYRHPNEAKWDYGSQPELLFINASGTVSTTFNSFSIDQGMMTFQGPFAFDSSITHVLEEVAPGWCFDSSYICWVPYVPPR